MDAYEKVRTDTVLRAMLSRAVEGIQATEGSLLLVSSDGQGLRFVLAHSPVEDRLVGNVEPLNKGISGLAFSLQQPMVVNDTDSDPSFDPTVDRRTGVKTKSILVVPLVSPTDEFGVLTAINSRREGGFIHQDLKTYGEAARDITEHLASLHLALSSQNDGPFD